MKTAEIRQLFLNYFEQQQHEIVASSPVVPTNDPSLLFTNAGMVQFKETFLGLEKRPYQRAVSSQKCLRAGGKHNDLENVGHTARHHTFFEMLGNFSFGDYSKREAIQYAWHFLTVILKLPPQKLWVTVYFEDQEAESIWLNELRIDPNMFSRCGAEDNFWSMGDTGPCGPCSEIYYDHGAHLEGVPPGSGEPGDRYVEIWNLVFMQYERNANGELVSLPRPSIDTGMGLERMTAVMQGVSNNYDIDLFKSLIEVASELTDCEDKTHFSLRVIADHIRACAFMILDGVKPHNEGRGYVLRRILRRAIRHGHQLGVKRPFFHCLVEPLSQIMGEAYPELVHQHTHIAQIILAEELQFSKTLDKGMKLLHALIPELKTKLIPGATIFKLYDTYGFPVDLINDIARELDFELDIAGFDQAMEQQKQRARKASQFGSELKGPSESEIETEFAGYEHTYCEATVVGLRNEAGLSITQLQAPEKGFVLLDKSPFYAEGGGQIGDRGYLQQTDLKFEVLDTKQSHKAYFHHGQMHHGVLTVGMKVQAEVASDQRMSTARNHSATHLLHAALRQVLGPQISQKGSLVDENRLRFDFSYDGGALSSDELQAVERLVNEQIMFNTQVQIELLNIEEARKKGAIALFGEKYAEEVRVLTMGVNDFSIEFCGGTHVKRTGDIGSFKITHETSISAGIRRIEALTGFGALDWLQKREAVIKAAAVHLKTTPELLEERARAMMLKQKQLIDELKNGSLSTTAKQKPQGALPKRIGDALYLFLQVDEADPKVLRSHVDNYKNQYPHAIILIIGITEQKIAVAVNVSQDLTQQVSAHELCQHLATLLEGKGGGRRDFAQAGSNQPQLAEQALKEVEPWLTLKLSK